LIGNCSTLQALYFGMSDPCVADRANNEKHKQTSGCLRIGSLDFIASRWVTPITFNYGRSTRMD